MRGGDEGRRNQVGITGSLAGAQMQSFKASVSKPTVKSGGNSTDSVLEKSEAVVYFIRVEGCGAHENVLEEDSANSLVVIFGSSVLSDHLYTW